MANTALDTTSKRVKWGKWLVHQALNKSVMARLEGTGSGPGTVIRVEKEKSVHTFYSEAISIVDGAPIGPDTALAGNERGQYLKSQAGYRTGYAQAVRVNKLQKTQTDVDLVKEAVQGLAAHWARTNDQLLVNYASAYNYAITDTTTTANIAVALSPSHATNITSLNTILNTALIGSTDCATAAYKGLNVLFAGKTADGGPITRPDADMITTMKANPENYKLSTDTFFYIPDYARDRGMFPTYLKDGKADFSSLLFLIPTPAITELRLNDARYQRAVSAGDIGAEEMWSGEMRMDRIGGLTIVPFDHPFPDTVTGVSGGTVLRVQASADGKWWIVEGLVLGGQSLAVSEYDDFEIHERDDKDYGRLTGVGYDIYRGALQKKRLSVADATTNIEYSQCMSVVFAMRKWN